MPGKKKKFIDKKKSVTFTLVHRSQYDPLMANPDAGQRVLKRQGKDDEKMTDEERRDAQRQLGVYYEDDYNYLQHLREAKELSELNPDEDIFYVPRETNDTKPAIVLPSSVFGSRYETEVGMLNKAAPNRDPKIEWDEDIVALLDADGVEVVDPDEELEDDFIEKANAMPSDESDGEEDGEEEEEEADDGDGEESTSDMEDDDEECDEMPPLEGDFPDAETRSRFTNYSMTSSVIRRNEKLSQLDSQFENLFVQYDEDEIGALDQEELDVGAVQVDSEYFKHIVNEFENKHEKRKREVNEGRGTRKLTTQQPTDGEGGNDGGDEEEEDDESSDTDREVVYVEDKPKEQWDCESVLSTCSNLYNRPKTIDEPREQRESTRGRMSRKGQMPAGVLPIARTSQTVEKKRLAAQPERKKGETTEERKARKQSVKMEKRERRVVKKMTKQVFKEEEKRQSQAMLNLKSNLQGIKLA